MSFAIHKAKIVFQQALKNQPRAVKRLADGQRQDYTFNSSIISITQNMDDFRVKHYNCMSSI